MNKTLLTTSLGIALLSYTSMSSATYGHATSQPPKPVTFTPITPQPAPPTHAAPHPAPPTPVYVGTTIADVQNQLSNLIGNSNTFDSSFQNLQQQIATAVKPCKKRRRNCGGNGGGNGGPVAVAEPSGLLILALGLLTFSITRRRK